MNKQVLDLNDCKKFSLQPTNMVDISLQKGSQVEALFYHKCVMEEFIKIENFHCGSVAFNSHISISYPIIDLTVPLFLLSLFNILYFY